MFKACSDLQCIQMYVGVCVCVCISVDVIKFCLKISQTEIEILE